MYLLSNLNKMQQEAAVNDVLVDGPDNFNMTVKPAY